MTVAPEAPEALLPDVRNYLDITWEDPDGDKKLLGIIARGMDYLSRLAGGGLDYTIETAPRQLLFDYCRYVRSNAFEQFQTNYQSELLALQIDRKADGYVQEQTATDLQ